MRGTDDRAVRYRPTGRRNDACLEEAGRGCVRVRRDDADMTAAICTGMTTGAIMRSMTTAAIVRRVRRARGARRVARLRAPVARGRPRRRAARAARHAPAGQAAAEPAVRRRAVPRRPGRGPGRVPRLHGGELAGDRGASCAPGPPRPTRPGGAPLLLPVLAALPQPLALLEVGASAGLCLYPDRYAYRYGDHAGRLRRAGPRVRARPGWRRRPACPRWCGGPAWT